MLVGRAISDGQRLPVYQRSDVGVIAIGKVAVPTQIQVSPRPPVIPLVVAIGHNGLHRPDELSVAAERIPVAVLV